MRLFKDRVRTVNMITVCHDHTQGDGFKIPDIV